MAFLKLANFQRAIFFIIHVVLNINLIGFAEILFIDRQIDNYIYQTRIFTEFIIYHRSAADEELLKIIEEEKLHVLQRQKEQNKQKQDKHQALLQVGLIY